MCRNIMAISVFLSAVAAAAAPAASKQWSNRFNLAPCAWSASGSNDYFILEPGYQQIFEAKSARLEITVLDETRMIAGVEARVVEERQSKNGQLVEVSRNFFAVCSPQNDV